jgi:hypothetical protein
MKTLNGKTELRVLRNNHWIRIPVENKWNFQTLVSKVEIKKPEAKQYVQRRD